MIRRILISALVVILVQTSLPVPASAQQPAPAKDEQTNGAASVQITTNDLGNSGAGGAKSDTDAVSITVNAVNDPPVNSIPGPQAANEDATLVLSTANGNAVSVSDPRFWVA